MDDLTIELIVGFAFLTAVVAFVAVIGVMEAEPKTKKHKCSCRRRPIGNKTYILDNVNADLIAMAGGCDCGRIQPWPFPKENPDGI